MALKNVIKTLIAYDSDTRFRYQSIVLNVEESSAGRWRFTIFHLGRQKVEGDSRISINDGTVSAVQGIIDKCMLHGPGGVSEIEQMQKEMSAITDDLLPMGVRNYLLSAWRETPFLVIEDDSVSLSLPYGVLFFPDSSVNSKLTSYGFFLSECYTLIRTRPVAVKRVLVSNMAIVCSDDLPGSVKEGEDIRAFLGQATSVNAFVVDSEADLKKALLEQKPESLHFCCHGNNSKEIEFYRNGTTTSVGTDFFNIFRFEDGAVVFLNICNSAYTVYDGAQFRSIADKFMDRNGAVVVATEWPIDDRFAYLIGTGFYKAIQKGVSVVETVHSLKQAAVSHEEKVTALCYSLQGNPKLRVTFA